MQNVDELCIKYVLNELDPSEIQLVEDAMANDENVLIEIESLRSTLRKVQNLPPKNVSDPLKMDILKLAENESQRKQSALKARKLKYAGYLAAATVTLALGSGLAFTWINGSSVPVESTDNIVQPLQENATIQPQASGLNMANTSLLQNETAVNEVQPWVDNRNMLRINVVNNAGSFSIMNADQTAETARQLRPVDLNQINSSSPMMRDIQLTRTQN